MKRMTVAILLIVLLFAGCKNRFRIYSIATMDRVSGREEGMLEVEDMLRVHGVQLLDEDDIDMAVEDGFLRIQRMRLCAAMRSDRLDGAVALGKKLDVDAVIFSTMPPPDSKFKEAMPCMVDSLITLYLVDPPTVIVEARDYGEFLYRLSQFDWETIVKPPPEPEEFEVALGDSVEFAGFVITVIANPSQSTSPMSEKETKEVASKNRNMSTDGEGGKGRIATQESDRPWAIAIYRDGYQKKLEPFETRLTNRIPGALKYDVSTIDSGSRFKLILTDLRVD